MDEYNLDQDQLDKLKQFQEVTNVEDNGLAICTLASLDWNVERAIENHLLGESDAPAPMDEDIEEVPVPVASGFTRQNEAVMDEHDLLGMHAMGSRIAHNGLLGLRHPLQSRTLRRNVADMDVTGPSSSSTNRNGNGPRVNHVRTVDSDDEVVLSDDDFTVGAEDLEEPKNKCNSAVPLIPTDIENVGEALHNFVQVFEARFGRQTGAVMPSFFTGSLEEAVKVAFDLPAGGRDDRRPLAIYIHHDRSVAANIFASTVMCKEEVSNLLRCQYVLWPWDITFRENSVKLHEWMQLLGLSDARHALDVIARDKERLPLLLIVTKDKGQFPVVDVCAGMDCSDQVLTKLMIGVDAFTDIRMTAANEQRDRDERERIRQEQAMEYEMSLVADKARMEAKEKEEREARELEERHRQEQEDQQIHRAKLESELPDEPAQGSSGAIVVKFRLPEGEQCVRRFRDSEKLSVLLKFLAAKGYATDNYRLFNSDFPKKDVSTWDSSQTFASLKWPIREQIFVEEH